MRVPTEIKDPEVVKFLTGLSKEFEDTKKLYISKITANHSVLLESPNHKVYEVTVDDAGNLLINGVVYPTGIDTAWTIYAPIVTAQTGTITSYSSGGRYKKIGKTVNIALFAQITNLGTATGYVNITLPFTSVNSLNQILVGREDGVTGKMLQGIVRPNAGAVSVLTYDNNVTAVLNYAIALSGTYEAA